MTHFQALESRLLMSATLQTVSADYAAILAARAPVSAALKPISTAIAGGNKTVAADLKVTADHATAAQNKRIVAKLRADEAKLISTLKHDTFILTGRGITASNAAKAAALASIKKPSASLTTRVNAAANKLNTIVAAALATIQGDTHLAVVDADLDALAAANTSNTQLAAETAALKSAVTVQALDTPAHTFATATGKLATDLLPPVTPPPPTPKTTTALIVANTTGGNITYYDLTTGANLGMLPTDASLHFPVGTAFDSAGNLFVSSSSNGTIVEFASTGGILSTTGTVFATESTLLASPAGPTGLVFDAAGNLYVADSSGAKIVKFPVVGGVLSSTASVLVSNNSGLVSGVYGMTFDSAGHLFVVNRAESVGEQVEEFDATTGAHLASFGSGNLFEPSGLAFDSNGDLFVSSYVSAPNNGGNNIVEFANIAGTLSGSGTVFANLPPNNDPIGLDPIGLVFDSAGNLYVANSNDHSIFKFAFTSGSLSSTPTVFASGVALQGPELLTIHTVTT